MQRSLKPENPKLEIRWWSEAGIAGRSCFHMKVGLRDWIELAKPNLLLCWVPMNSIVGGSFVEPTKSYGWFLVGLWVG